MNDAALTINHLTVRYRGEPRSAISDVSLQLRRGEILGVLGHSGSGKSTLALTIMNILPHSAQRESGQVDTLNHSLAMIFQESTQALDPVFTIGQQLRSMFRQRGRKSDPLNLLSSMGFEHPADIIKCYPHELSGGMNQRVMLAMALGCQPDILIADEPTSALDVVSQARVMNLLMENARAAHTAVLLISHDLGLVAQYCDRVMVLDEGRCVEEAPVDALFSEPGSKTMRDMLAAVPRLGLS